MEKSNYVCGLNSRISALSQSGSYRPTVQQGGTAITFDNPIGYWRVGKLVFMQQAFWSVSVTGGDSSILRLATPLPVVSPRAIGSFGYNNSGKNYIPIVISTSNGGSLGFSVKNASTGAITDVKGNEFTSFIGQWSAVYTTT